MCVSPSTVGVVFFFLHAGGPGKKNIFPPNKKHNKLTSEWLVHKPDFPPVSLQRHPRPSSFITIQLPNPPIFRLQTTANCSS